MEEKINSSELLVFMLKNVDGDPFILLADICKPIVIRAIKRRYIRGFDNDDFWQEANQVLVESIAKYRFEEDMKFLQYYSMQLENHLNMLVRKETALKRRSIKEATSYDALSDLKSVHFHSASGYDATPEETAIVKETLDEYMQDLSNFEKEVFFFYIGDIPYSEIAEILKCDRDKVQNAIYRCGVKLKKLIRST